MQPSIPLSRPSTGSDELRALQRVLESGWLAGQGPEGTTLESGFVALTGRRHAIAVSNCTAGLHLALLALGVGHGDEVLVADYTFPATGHAVLYCGAEVVPVDVRSDTGTIDPARLPELIGPRTVGIIGVDALGMPADWHEVTAIARDHDLWVLEDAACGAGATYGGAPCGSFGDVAVFSLHARKGITSGEGGVVVTDDDAIAAAVRSMSCFGMTSAHQRQRTDGLALPAFAELGYNYKLSDLLAAVASVQLSRLAELTQQRREIARRYEASLAGLERLTTPVEPVDRTSSWQTYAVTLNPDVDRQSVVGALRAAGIGCTIGTYALSAIELYGATTPRPVSGGLFLHQLAIPMYPELTEAQQDRVVSELRTALTAGQAI